MATPTDPGRRLDASVYVIYIRFVVAPRPVDATFDLEALTPGDGMGWRREADEALDLSTSLAAEIRKWRRRRCQHPLVSLVRRQLYPIACGYQDQNDATKLLHPLTVPATALV